MAVSLDAKPPIVFLSGERIYARPFELCDVERFQRWLNDPATRVTLAHHLPLTEKMEREYIENVGKQQDAIHLCIVLKEGDRHIGGMGLHQIRWKDRAAVFGIFIGETAYRGKGYGVEATRLMLRYAFETLNLNRIELWVYDFNKAAIRTYEKAGFVCEGVRRQNRFVEGRYVDESIYGILAGEYFAQTR